MEKQQTPTEKLREVLASQKRMRGRPSADYAPPPKRAEVADGQQLAYLRSVFEQLEEYAHDFRLPEEARYAFGKQSTIVARHIAEIASREPGTSRIEGRVLTAEEREQIICQLKCPDCRETHLDRLTPCPVSGRVWSPDEIVFPRIRDVRRLDS